MPEALQEDEEDETASGGSEDDETEETTTKQKHQSKAVTAPGLAHRIAAARCRCAVRSSSSAGGAMPRLRRRSCRRCRSGKMGQRDSSASSRCAKTKKQT